MTRKGLTGAMLACLGLGAADLAALNMWVLPPLLAIRPTVTGTGAAAETAPAAAPATETAPAAAPAAARAPAAAAAPAPETAPATAPESQSDGEADPGADDGSGPLGVISFERGSTRVGRRATDAILRLAARLRRETGRIEVAGHADASGSDEVNDRLSRLRAEAVAQRLERAGVPRKRLAITYFGNRRPSGLPNDRRVEVLPKVTP